MNWIDKAQTCWLKNASWSPARVLTFKRLCTGALLFLGLAALRVGALLHQDEPLVAAVCTRTGGGATRMTPRTFWRLTIAPLALSYTGDLRALAPRGRGGARLLRAGA